MTNILDKLKLSQYGIEGVSDVVYNPSYEQLYKEEMNPALEGFDVGVESEFGAVGVASTLYDCL